MHKKIRLPDLIRGMRQDFQQVVNEQADNEVLFSPRQIEIETSIMAEKSTSKNGKLDIWVLSLGADAKETGIRGQRVKITMTIHRRMPSGKIEDLVFGESDE